MKRNILLFCAFIWAAVAFSQEPPPDRLTVAFSDPSRPGVLKASLMNGGMTLSPATIIKVNNTGAPLATGAYVLIANASGGLVAGSVTNSVTVDGNGAVTHDRVFQILSSVSAVTMTGMTIRNGLSLSSTVGTIGGGGLYIEGSGHLRLNDVIFAGNTALNGGGLYTNFSSQGGSVEMDHVVMRANIVIAGGVGAGGDRQTDVNGTVHRESCRVAYLVPGDAIR